jgi:hypothetical protein
MIRDEEFGEQKKIEMKNPVTKNKSEEQKV